MAPFPKRCKAQVALAPSIEGPLRRIYCSLCDAFGGQLLAAELASACVDQRDVASFFGFDEDARPEEVQTFFHGLVARGSSAITWDVLKSWYWQVLLDKAGEKLDATLPPDPTWLAVGGQCMPNRPLVRVSNDDLLEATLRGDIGLVRRLVDAKASVNVPIKPVGEDVYMNLLHTVVVNSQVPHCTRTVAELLRRRADVDAQTSSGSTPLIYAAMGFNVEAAEVLLEHGASTDVLDDYGCSAAHAVVASFAVNNAKFQHDEDTEFAALEFIKLLAKWGCNLSILGGIEKPVTPVAQAVVMDCTIMLTALLDAKAQPDGLVDAVNHSSPDVVKVLYEANANMNIEDPNGRSLLELASFRGDPAMQDMVKDLLDRSNGRMMKPLMSMRANTRVFVKSVHKMEEEVSFASERSQNETPRGGLLRSTCLGIARSGYFHFVILCVLLAALFLRDIWEVAAPTTDDVALDQFVIAFIVLFLLEAALQIVAFGMKYIKSFLFLGDLLGLVSLAFDYSDLLAFFVSDNFRELYGAKIEVKAPILLVLSRVLRLMKIVKIFRFLPGAGVFWSDGMEERLAIRVSSRIKFALIVQLGIAIVFLCFVELLDSLRYPLGDASMFSSLQIINVYATQFPDSLQEQVTRFVLFYSGMTYKPQALVVTYANGTDATFKWSSWEAAAPKYSMSVNVGAASAIFNITSIIKVSSWVHIIEISVILAQLLLVSLCLSMLVHRIVLLPMEMFMQAVQRAVQILLQSVDKDKEDQPDDKAVGVLVSAYSSFENVASDSADVETSLINRALEKLNNFQDTTHRKKVQNLITTIDCVNDLDEEVITCIMEQACRDVSDDAFSNDDLFIPNLDKAVGLQIFADTKLKFSQFEVWNFRTCSPTVDVYEAALLPLIASGVWQHASAPDQIELYGAFINEVESHHSDRLSVPFHNWVHSVDVAGTLYRLFQRVDEIPILSKTHRFALTVAALAHGIGKKGYTNQYLKQTGDELALRYNDASPLENFAAAKISEILRVPETALFGTMTPLAQTEARRVVIESILFTDIAKHFVLFEELEALHKANIQVVEEGLAKFKDGHWSDPEVIEMLRSPNFRSVFCKLAVHLCDMSYFLKGWIICRQWCTWIHEELLRQGDVQKEVGLPVSPLHDRAQVVDARLHLAYIESVVWPITKLTIAMLPPLDFCQQAISSNAIKLFEDWKVEPGSAAEREKLNVKDRLGKSLRLDEDEPFLSGPRSTGGGRAALVVPMSRRKNRFATA